MFVKPLAKLKKSFKSLMKIVIYNSWMCPDCYDEVVECTAFTRLHWDKRSKSFKKYIKCENCSRTTPMYDRLEDAVEQWNDQWKIVQSKKNEKC